MESCVVVCRTAKAAARKGKILFINAKAEVERKNSESYLTAEHIAKIAVAYRTGADVPGFAKMVERAEIEKKGCSLNIALYVGEVVKRREAEESFEELWAEYRAAAARAAEDIGRVERGEGLTTDYTDCGKACGADAKNAKVAKERKEVVGSRVPRDRVGLVGAAPRAARQTVTFGEVAREVKVNVDRAHNPYERYVAGDHMDTEDLVIHRSGCFATDDVGPAFTRLFKPGQILYGSRRTYLKKVALADFEGITANTTFVLEAKDENLMRKDLLPFLMLSDDFTNYSIQHSKGSTNPYILFSDLAAYSFSLPPLEEQKKLASALWAMERVKRAYKKLLAETDRLVEARIEEIILPLIHDGNSVAVEDLVEADRPVTYGIVKPGLSVPGGIPVVKVKDFPNGVIDESDLLYTDPKIEAPYKRSRLKEGDLLISIRGSVGRMAEVPASLNGANITQDTARLSLKPEYEINYIRGVLASTPIQHEIERNIIGVAMKGINLGFLRKLRLPIAPLSLQREFAAFVGRAEKAKASLKGAIKALTAAQKAKMNGAFREGGD